MLTFCRNLLPHLWGRFSLSVSTFPWNHMASYPTILDPWYSLSWGSCVSQIILCTCYRFITTGKITNLYQQQDFRNCNIWTWILSAMQAAVRRQQRSLTSHLNECSQQAPSTKLWTLSRQWRLTELDKKLKKFGNRARPLLTSDLGDFSLFLMMKCLLSLATGECSASELNVNSWKYDAILLEW